MVLLASMGGATFAAPASTSAAASQPIYTHVFTETRQMTSDQCTAVRKVNANASCTIIHTTKMSDFIPTKGTTGMVALTSCPTGDLYFDDYYTNVSPVAYQLEMT